MNLGILLNGKLTCGRKIFQLKPTPNLGFCLLLVQLLAVHLLHSSVGNQAMHFLQCFVCSVLSILNCVILACRLKPSTCSVLTAEGDVFSLLTHPPKSAVMREESYSVLTWQASSRSAGAAREGNGKQMTFLPLEPRLKQFWGLFSKI